MELVLFLVPLQGQSLTYFDIWFDMHLYEDQKVFSASVNNLNLKPLHSRILR